MTITIKFKDGTEKIFRHEGRAGGSYTKTIKYEGGYAIVKDEWDKTYAYPNEEIKEIITEPNRYF